MNRVKLAFVMMVWGSIGVFTRAIPLSALQLAFFRALIAIPVLFAAMKIKKAEKAVRWNLYIPYVVSGVLLGFGWLTLFYGYKLTSVSSAVIIYNMCPIYVMIAAPILLKESITRSQILVILSSFLGLFLIVWNNLLAGASLPGMAASALSGMIYAAIVLLNRGIRNRLCNETATFVQIVSATVVLLPFVIFGGGVSEVVELDARPIVFTVLLGVLHTGIAYTMFFSVYRRMRSVEIATYGYLEPVFGIGFSVLLLNETLTLIQIAGGILILGSAFIGGLRGSRESKKMDMETAQQPNETGESVLKREG